VTIAAPAGGHDVAAVYETLTDGLTRPLRLKSFSVVNGWTLLSIVAAVAFDWFMVAADFEAYCTAQRQADARWQNKRGWQASAVRNVANVGWFSSDRTIQEYAHDIWGMT